MPQLSHAMHPLPDGEHRLHLRRVVIASTTGTAIEWYDFFPYSTVTGLVFAKLFFPQSNPLAGTLQAFTVYLIGFVARPIGAAVPHEPNSNSSSRDVRGSMSRSRHHFLHWRMDRFPQPVLQCLS
jgi:hypothetical protein